MTQELWSAVDDYIGEQLIGADAALDAATADSAAAGLPAIAVSPPLGKMLTLLAQIQGARSILEVGTLGGYSTICFARALPADGRLITLELDPRYADVARANIERAGLSALVELRVGAAIETLDELISEDVGPFDLVFIDADKESTPAYFERALELTRPGSVILVDNVVRAGEVADAGATDPRVLGMRGLHELLAADRAGPQRVSATTIQTVGSKGYDGFTLALVNPA